MVEVTILDGGMGSELRARGVEVPRTIWSAAALSDDPEAVVSLHKDYAAVGATVITTNNYGVIPGYLEKVGREDELVELTDCAGVLAARARDEVLRETGRPIRIAGSLPPLVESYRADLVRPLDEIVPIYRQIAAALRPHVDLYLCETMSTADEAVAAVKAAAAERRVEQPIWVAWTLAEGPEIRLRSGEPVELAFAALADLPVDAFLFNCCQPEVIGPALRALRALTDKPIGGYANGFEAIPDDFHLGSAERFGQRDELNPDRYADFAEHWRAAGATILGGCCCIGPKHIEELHRRFI